MCEAGVATFGTADSFLKGARLTRTRHGHQGTALDLAKQQDAWQHIDPQDGTTFEVWKLIMVEKSPTF